MAAEQLVAMTGMPLAEATQYIEMAGGDVETAVSLYFDMAGGDGGGGGGGAPVAVPAQAPASPAQALVFGSEPVPEAWSQQGFEFSQDPASACCILQRKNGPCGVLAAVNAIVVAQAGCPEPSTPIDDAALCRALALVLARCALAAGADGAPPTPARAMVATWADGAAGGELLETEVEATESLIAAHLAPHAAAFRGPGGVCLLCYSAVLTRGLDRVRAEAALDGGSVPLVSGPHALCTTDLMGLLMEGKARGNVSAYGSDGAKVTWRARSEVGLLSRDELEMGRPLADELKGPSKPVYVLHGGDHFTLLWAPGAGASTADGKVDFVHWNGLPPNRALVRLRLGRCSLEPPPPAPAQHVPSHWRIKLGEVESIVQARPADKQARPGCWRTHAYELALATQAVVADDASEERPPDLPQPAIFEQGELPAEGEAWRCASCYQTRFKTMCFGENPAPAARSCKFCGQAQAETGWTLWRRYDELPASLQRRVDRTSGPKLLAVLATRWPDVEVGLFDDGGKEVALGGEGFNPSVVVTPST